MTKHWGMKRQICFTLKSNRFFVWFNWLNFSSTSDPSNIGRYIGKQDVIWFQDSIYGVKKKIYTARKVSVFGAFLVRIFPHSDWIWRDTKYLSVFSPKAGNKDQKNSEYGYFSSSDMVTSSCIQLTIAYYKPCERSMMEHFCDNN